MERWRDRERGSMGMNGWERDQHFRLQYFREYMYPPMTHFFMARSYTCMDCVQYIYICTAFTYLFVWVECAYRYIVAVRHIFANVYVNKTKGIK